MNFYQIIFSDISANIYREAGAQTIASSISQAKNKCWFAHYKAICVYQGPGVPRHILAERNLKSRF